MEENPYQSPKSAPEVEKRPKKPLSRYWFAFSCGFVAFSGFVWLQRMIWQIVWLETNTVPSLTQKRLMLPAYVLLASPLGVLIAWWTLRAPNKWVLAISMLLGLTPWVLAFVGIVLFGLIR